MSGDEERQLVLFAGMDCLPGQLDLFPTDGEPTPEDDEDRSDGEVPA